MNEEEPERGERDDPLWLAARACERENWVAVQALSTYAAAVELRRIAVALEAPTSAFRSS